jgi:hypothetical protein
VILIQTIIGLIRKPGDEVPEIPKDPGSWGFAVEIVRFEGEMVRIHTLSPPNLGYYHSNSQRAQNRVIGSDQV